MNSDILFIVFGYSNIKDLLSCSLVCKEFNEIANHNVIWKQLYIQRYTTLHFIQPSYRRSYETCYKLTKFMKRFNLTIDLDGLNKLSEINLSYKSLTDIPNYVSLTLGSLRSRSLRFTTLSALCAHKGFYTIFSEQSEHE